jgi:hypothetical protein
VHRCRAWRCDEFEEQHFVDQRGAHLAQLLKRRIKLALRFIYGGAPSAAHPPCVRECHGGACRMERRAPRLDQ